MRFFKYISYGIILLAVLVNGTTIAMFHSYYKIYKILKESTQNLNAHSTEVGASSSERRRTDIKLLKTSFAVVCTFVVTMTPGSVLVICETAGCLIPRTISLASVYLMFTSGLVNPIIYGLMNPQFQAAFKRALRFGRCGNNQVSQRWTRDGIRPCSKVRCPETI